MSVVLCCWFLVSKMSMFLVRLASSLLCRHIVWCFCRASPCIALMWLCARISSGCWRPVRMVGVASHWDWLTIGTYGTLRYAVYGDWLWLAVGSSTLLWERDGVCLKPTDHRRSAKNTSMNVLAGREDSLRPSHHIGLCVFACVFISGISLSEVWQLPYSLFGYIQE